jgi:pimeloyl-ACP methyl ester carboxylesterase
MERADALPITHFYDAPRLSDSKPGDLLRQESFDGYSLPSGARAVRILYHSLNAAGRSVATSAVILVPAGPAPAGGWPVIAWAHGTTGVARLCAPSLQKDLAYGEEGLFPMVRAGFAVVATDYHGLGTVGPHQYVNKLAQAQDVIYSIPAARTAEPGLGRRWAAVGHSQGGLAAWGVAELEATRRDPDYLGAISVAGGGNIEGILRAMSDTSSSAAYYLMYMAYAIHAASPEFRPEAMLAGRGLKEYASATTEGCWNYAYATFIGHEHEKAAIPGWTETPAAKRFFHDAEIGHAPIAGPLLVIAGEGDETVPIAHVRAAVDTACRNGIALQFRTYPGLDHDPTMDKSTPDQLAWIRERMSGLSATNSCPEIAKPR